MQWLADICVRRPVFATVLVLSLIVVGVFGYTHLGVDRFPKVDFPIVTVLVREDGASPEEIETDVVDKLEESINTIAGIDQMFSYSFEGYGQVMVQFVLEKDLNVAVEEVRNKVNQAMPNLPPDIRAPVVDKIDPDAAPIMDIALSSRGGIRETTEYADKVLRRQLESLSGVGQVRLIGKRSRQINLWLDPQNLRARDLTAIDVQRALQAQNIQVPGGSVDQDTRELTLRTHGRVRRPAEFNEIVIGKRGGVVVKLSDVGRIEDGMEEERTVARLYGRPADSHPGSARSAGQFNGASTVLLSIRKQSGTNTVATVDSLLERLARIRKSLPGGYELRVVRDQSEYIRASTNAVREHLVLGSIFAALVVLVFLWNFRTTIISAIAIPTSIISTFALMYWEGFTLNGITLLALALSVGIVIDDAIVVLENIFRFIEEKGMNPFEAAIEGTREIGLAVMATTLSLIAVFLPVAFMTGIVGRFMNSFGMTMAFAIAVSLLVSFTLTPMLSSRWIRPPAGGPKDDPTVPEGMPVGMPPGTPGGGPGAHESPAAESGHTGHGASKQTGLFRVLDAVYSVMLRWSMRHRWAIVLLCFGALFSMKWIVPLVPKNFLPEDDESQFQITARAAEGASRKATEEIGARIAQDVTGLKGVAYAVMTVGNNDQQTVNLVSIFVKLVDIHNRPRLSQQDIMQRARREILPKYGSLRSSIGLVPAFSSGAPQSAITYYIAGPDLTKLTAYSDRVLREMHRIPGVVDADSSLIVGKPELGINIDRQRSAELGVSVADIANTMRILVGGLKVSDYYENGEQYEVHLRAELPFRNSVEQISRMSVPSTTTGSVPMDQVTSFEAATGPAQIARLDRRRNVTFTCNLLPGYSQQTVLTQLQKIIDDLHMPPNYASGPVGTSKELTKAFMAFAIAFLLAIVFMYLILAAQFESWVHPITILLALPLTVPFALLGILLTGQSMNIFSILGILVLFGVVKKNGILQVDHTNQLRARGMNRYDAIIAANRDRLRPILMTTVAFVIGMVPLVWSGGVGAATNRSIGFTVIGGQTLSLVLTLLATPVFYSLFDDMAALWGRFRGFLARLVRHRARGA